MVLVCLIKKLRIGKELYKEIRIKIGGIIYIYIKCWVMLC